MFWKHKPKGKERADSSSASDSGDSPTSTTSQQAQIPAPADGCHSGQASTSRRNETGCSSSPTIVASIVNSSEGPDDTELPTQPTPVLDYQPSGYGPPPPSSSSKGIYGANYDDLYARELATYKFGSPSITTMTDTSSQIDPLSSEEDFPHPGADTTPRPSLAVQTEGIRSHPSQVTSPSDQFSAVSHRPARNDVSSTHTFGMRSPASESVSSLSNASGSNQAQARAETSQEQSSDDEPRARYYTFPYVDSLYSSSLDSNFTREEFYYDDEDFSDPDLDLGSAHYDEVGSYDQSYWDTPPDQDSFIADYLPQRRGSNPIAIPGAQEESSQGRDREDSVATVKYPPPSVSGPSTKASRSPTMAVSNPLSLPNNDADWDQRMRAVHERRIDPSVARSHPPVHAIDYASVSPLNFPGPPMGPSGSHLHIDGTALEFDMREWQNIASGIKGGADLSDVDALPIMDSGNANNFWSRFAADGPRRPSIASTINDTFQKHALAFRDQDWSFRKDKADGSSHVKKKRNTFIPFNERPVVRRAPWKGMVSGEHEYWRNDLTGMYKVERMEIHAGENRPPQQRLSIHHIRDGSRQVQRPINGLPFDPHNGPTTTVHKHSKAAAFSLSRHYRDKSQSKSADRRGNTSKVQPLRNAVYINGKKTAMILLAPRKVQEAYTSTTTTRKLESHGLLDDAHRSREMERLKRLAEQDDQLREKAKRKEKARQEKERRKAAEERAKRDKGKGKARGQGSTIHSDASTLTQVEGELANLSTSPARPQTASTPPFDSPPQASPETGPPSPHSREQDSAALVSATPLETPSAPVASSENVHTAEVNARVQDLPPPLRSLPHLASAPLEVQANAPHLSSPRPNQLGSVILRGPVNPNEVYPFSQGHYDPSVRQAEEPEEEDQELEELGIVPRRRKRTPHNEAYHSLSPESIDSFAAQQENHSRGFLPWFSGRNASTRTLQHIDTPYHPPWLSAPSRPNNHDMQMQVVAGLNTSFQGVGLLPTDKEIRESRKRRALKNQARDAARTERKYTKEKDIFIDLPDDALYMLLPLWPSETDPVSSRDHPFQLPPIAILDRLYALVYYKPYYPPESSGKGKNKDKSRRSRGSPTSSQDGIYIDERNVLMSQFYIGARIVAYDDLEGSNVRVPELGLSVMGPLQDAYETIPVNQRPPKPRARSRGKGEEKEFWDYIIGSYQSREHPMEFYPEGFKKMGLATQQTDNTDHEDSTSSTGPPGSNTSVPSSTAAPASGSGSIRQVSSNNASTSSLASVSSGSGSTRGDLNNIAPFGETGPSDILPNRFPSNSEEDPIQEPPILLTPIGRAVLEMAFMGALAVTGFAPQPFW